MIASSSNGDYEFDPITGTAIGDGEYDIGFRTFVCRSGHLELSDTLKSCLTDEQLAMCVAASIAAS